MRITNPPGDKLPEPLFEAVKNDSYSRGDAEMSVTQILAPPRKVELERRHWDELEEPASSRIWALLGQSIHTILERANRTGIAERRLSITVEGWKISGGMDLVCDQGILSDYKVTSAYKFKDGKAPEDFEQQLNCYAEILRQNGESVKAAQVVGILRDWSKLEASRDPSYPQSQVAIVPIKLWTPEYAQAFIRERVLLHQKAREILPECSPQERWAKPDIWAVKKKGAKAAERGGLYENEAAAQAHAAENPQFYVEFRPGESTRCRHYCSVASVCTFYQSLLARKTQPEGSEA